MAMNSVEPTWLENSLLIISLVALILSWWFRIQIFTKLSEHPVIAELTRKTTGMALGDLLSLSLFRARARLPDETKLTIFSFIALDWIGSTLLLVMFAIYGIRNLT